MENDAQGTSQSIDAYSSLAIPWRVSPKEKCQGFGNSLGLRFGKSAKVVGAAQVSFL
ncbi:hypothetical protein [Mesorhizobium sp. M0522]|uniref:hypothetical protein n=1 Tax=Mesorhizobium sp. M0522 TaxID=2956958 RepID=UPI0033398428